MSVKRECAVRRAGVEVVVSAGQYLVYELSIEGARPLFVIADQHENVILAPVGPPKAVYVQKWPEAPPPAHDLTHTLNLAFLGTQRARYRVVLFNHDSSPVVTLKDCVYEATDPADWVLESLRILAR